MRAIEFPPRRVLAATLLSYIAGVPLAAQAQTAVEVTVVNDPRPLMLALNELEKRLGWVLTYEDPRWVYAGDLQDRSVLTGKPYDAKNPSPVPRGGAFKFSATARLGGEKEKAELVRTLLQEYQLSPGHQGEFTMIQTADAIHVVPAQAKDAQGKLEARASILDTPIQLAAGTRSALAVTDEVMKAVSAATGMKVEAFFVPTNLFWHTHVTVDERPADETARAALSYILKATGRKLSWRLVYLPDFFQGYALSVHEVKGPNN